MDRDTMKESSDSDSDVDTASDSGAAGREEKSEATTNWLSRQFHSLLGTINRKFTKKESDTTTDWLSSGLPSRVGTVKRKFAPIPITFKFARPPEKNTLPTEGLPPLPPFPTIKVLAFLANHAYKVYDEGLYENDLPFPVDDSKDIIKISQDCPDRDGIVRSRSDGTADALARTDGSLTATEGSNNVHGSTETDVDDLNDWKCVATALYCDGYCGSAYFNFKTFHLVIAHGGTKFRLHRPWIGIFKDIIRTDIMGIVFNREVSQIITAYLFSKRVISDYADRAYSISLTGHSLGGWLAQVCAAYIEHPSFIDKETWNRIQDREDRYMANQNPEVSTRHLHTVTFDSPGCMRVFRRISGIGRYEVENWSNKIESLDMTIILATTNIVNTCGAHVGYVLLLNMENTITLIQSHYMKSILPRLYNDPVLTEVREARWMRPVSPGDEICLKGWYIGKTHACPVSILSLAEIDFLEVVRNIISWKHGDTLGPSLSTILKSDDHKSARDILVVLKSIEEKIRDYQIDNKMLKLTEGQQLPPVIEVLLNSLRANPHWLPSMRELRTTFRVLPNESRRILCQGSVLEYLARIPPLCACQTESMCQNIKKFLNNLQDTTLNITFEEEPNANILVCIGHILYCFRNWPHLADSSDGRPSKALFLNIERLKYLHLFMGMECVFSKNGMELVVLQCESNMSGENLELVESMIQDAENTKGKLILVSKDSLTSISWSDNSNFNLHALKPKFDRRTEFDQAWISQCVVNIDGDRVSLFKTSTSTQYLTEQVEELLEQVECSELTRAMLSRNELFLSAREPPNKAIHYIPRKIRQYKSVLNVQALSETVDFFDKVVISTRIDEKRSFGLPAYVRIFERAWNYTNTEFFIEYESTFKPWNVHLFRWIGSKLVWLASKESVCSNYLHDDIVISDEADLLQIENNFVILSDESGSGKSATIVNLFLEFKKLQMESNNCEYSWPVYINLSSCEADLIELEYSYQSGLDFLVKAIQLEAFGSSLLKFLLSTNAGRVVFFIDSFNEISGQGQKFILEMLKQFKSTNDRGSNIRVIIATQKHAACELEKCLETKASEFCRIDIEDQVTFLANCLVYQRNILDYWKNSERENAAIVSRANVIGKQIGNYVVDGNPYIYDDDIRNRHFSIGIPLLLVLLTTVHEDEFNAILDRDPLGTVITRNILKDVSRQFLSKQELFASFIDRVFDITLEDMSRFEHRTDWMDDEVRIKIDEKLGMSKFGMYDIHSRAAFMYLSTSLFPNSNLLVENLSQSDLHDINEGGLCESTLQWRKTFHIPQEIFERIKKTSDAQNELDVLFLTSKNSTADRYRVQHFLGGRMSVEFKFGSESVFNELRSQSYGHGVRQVYWFVEDNDSNYHLKCLESTETKIDSAPLEFELRDYRFRFCHQAIAEFFAAKYLVSQIDDGQKSGVVLFLKRHYHQKYFEKVRYFLDSFLCIDIPVLENLEVFFNKGLEEICINLDWTRVDRLGRTLLHYACLYGDHKEGIFWMMHDLSLFHVQDNLGKSCLSYFELSEYIPICWLSKLDFRSTEEYLRVCEKNFSESQFQYIVELLLCFTFFSGEKSLIWSFESIRKAIRLYKADPDTLEPGLLESRNFKILLEQLEKRKSELTRNLGANVECIIQCDSRIQFLIRRLLHPICLEYDSRNTVLKDWLLTCLDKKIPGGYKFVVDIIDDFCCTEYNELQSVVFTELKKNLLEHYTNIYCELNEYCENYLWRSCSKYKEKEQMVIVMRNFNFYTLMRAVDMDRMWFEEIIQFIRSQAQHLQTQMNEGLVKAFHVLLFTKPSRPWGCVTIWSFVNEEEIKVRIRDENFELRNKNPSTSPMFEIDDHEHLKRIVEGKDDVWVRRSMNLIKKSDWPNHFFTLP